jgi:hypothetical protein
MLGAFAVGGNLLCRGCNNFLQCRCKFRLIAFSSVISVLPASRWQHNAGIVGRGSPSTLMRVEGPVCRRQQRFLHHSRRNAQSVVRKHSMVPIWG